MSDFIPVTIEDNCKNILVVHNKPHRGDLVLTTPILKKYRQMFPDSKITIVVKPHNVELFLYSPDIDEVICSQCSLDMLEKEYDLIAFLSENMHEDDWILNRDSFIVNGKKVVGNEYLYENYKYPAKYNFYRIEEDGSFVEDFGNIYDGAGLDKTHLLHRFAARGGVYVDEKCYLYPHQNDIDFANKFIKYHKNVKYFVAISPKASMRDKSLTKNFYNNLINYFLGFDDVVIMLFGIFSNNILKNRLVNMKNATMMQMAALLTKCCLSITCDSVGSHISAAMNVNQITFNNDVFRTFPLNDKAIFIDIENLDIVKKNFDDIRKDNNFKISGKKILCRDFKLRMWTKTFLI